MKIHTSLIFWKFLVLSVLFTKSVKGEDIINIAKKLFGEYIERKFNCWPSNLGYDKFSIKYHFFTEKTNDQIYDSETQFNPELYDFDPRRRTSVLMHGYLNQVMNGHIAKIKNQLLLWVRIQKY